jgi:hypothetical protein
MIYTMWVEGAHSHIDPKTNLLPITKDNDFSKLKGFLKHDHFACILAQFNLIN